MYYKEDTKKRKVLGQIQGDGGASQVVNDLKPFGWVLTNVKMLKAGGYKFTEFTIEKRAIRAKNPLMVLQLQDLTK